MSAYSARSRRYRAMRLRVLGDSGLCAICGRPIEMGLPWNHPLSATVDHRIPVSLGGDPEDLTNLRPAHKGCNSRRGNRLVVGARRSRRW